MGSLPTELRYAFRRLAQAPWFSVTVVLMLAFGIGASATIFSLVEGILLRPLPFHDSGRLVQLGEHVGENPGIGTTARGVRAYSVATTAFSSLGGFAGTSFELAGPGFPEQVAAARLTAGVFPTLDVPPLLGRVFTRQEEDSRAPVAVISYGMWTHRYHRDPHILGSSIELNRSGYTVIGVMPRDFEFPVQAGRLDQAQLWVPLSLTPQELSGQSAGVWGFQMVGRLKPGVSVQQAGQDVGRVAEQIMRDFPANLSKIHIRGDVRLLTDEVVGDTRPLLWALFAAVLVVLSIACANVAILMLLRAIRRHRDHAVRLALGASRAAILWEMLAEGWILSLAGGLLGLALAGAGVRSVSHFLPDTLPRMDSVAVDAGATVFALGAALLTGLLCSLAPAFVVSRTNLVVSLKESARTGTGAATHGRIRSALAMAEIAVALVLLTASFAFLRSYQKMLAIDPGFRPEHVLVAGYQLPSAQYPANAAIETFNKAVTQELSSKPGVLAVGIGISLPSSNFAGMAGYTLEGERSQGWKLKFAGFVPVYGNYFEALGIPLLSGRLFTESDRAGAPAVIIVSQSMAQHSWPGQNPIGKRMHAGNPNRQLPWATVVGVVANTRIGPRDGKSNDQWYVPAVQPEILNESAPPRAVPAGGFIVLRAALPPEQMAGVLRASVAEIDPLLALNQVRSMGDVLATTEAPRTFMTEWIGAFALAALALAMTGIYAVIAFSASLRTQEIAIRMALGAQRKQIARLVLRSGAMLALVGCGLGIIGSLAISHVLRSFLFDVSPTDPWIYIGSALVMMLIAILASALPAMRAASGDPVDVLRSM
ncbi:MAG: ABC transporter permease [Acidobacteriaceae bacterium]